MIKRDISLYHIEDFHAYESQQLALGKTVQSVTYFLNNKEIAKLVPFVDIIDLSAYLENRPWNTGFI